MKKNNTKEKKQHAKNLIHTTRQRKKNKQIKNKNKPKTIPKVKNKIFTIRRKHRKQSKKKIYNKQQQRRNRKKMKNLNN